MLSLVLFVTGHVPTYDNRCADRCCTPPHHHDVSQVIYVKGSGSYRVSRTRTIACTKLIPFDSFAQAGSKSTARRRTAHLMCQEEKSLTSMPYSPKLTTSPLTNLESVAEVVWLP